MAWTDYEMALLWAQRYEQLGDFAAAIRNLDEAAKLTAEADQLEGIAAAIERLKSKIDDGR